MSEVGTGYNGALALVHLLSHKKADDHIRRGPNEANHCGERKKRGSGMEETIGIFGVSTHMQDQQRRIARTRGTRSRCCARPCPVPYLWLSCYVRAKANTRRVSMERVHGH